MGRLDSRQQPNSQFSWVIEHRNFYLLFELQKHMHRWSGCVECRTFLRVQSIMWNVAKLGTTYNHGAMELIWLHYFLIMTYAVGVPNREFCLPFLHIWTRIGNKYFSLLAFGGIKNCNMMDNDLVHKTESLKIILLVWIMVTKSQHKNYMMMCSADVLLDRDS